MRESTTRMNDDDDGYPTHKTVETQAQGNTAPKDLKRRLSHINMTSVAVIHFCGIGI